MEVGFTGILGSHLDPKRSLDSDGRTSSYWVRKGAFQEGPPPRWGEGDMTTKPCLCLLLVFPAASFKWKPRVCSVLLTAEFPVPRTEPGTWWSLNKYSRGSWSPGYLAPRCWPDGILGLSSPFLPPHLALIITYPKVIPNPYLFTTVHELSLGWGPQSHLPLLA